MKLRVRRSILYLILVSFVIWQALDVIEDQRARADLVVAADRLDAAAADTGTLDLRLEQAAFAERCARAWFTFDSHADQELRDSQVAACAAPGVDGSWTGEGSQTVVAASVADIDSAADDVTLVAVDLDVVTATGTVHRRVRVAVTEDRSGGYGVAAPPASIPPAERTAATVRVADGETDTPLAGDVEDTLSGFFAAYYAGRGNEADRYATDDVTLGVLDGEDREFVDITETAVTDPDRDGTRTATVTVETRDGGLTRTEQFAVAVRRDDSRWYVEHVDVAAPTDRKDPQ